MPPSRLFRPSVSVFLLALAAPALAADEPSEKNLAMGVITKIGDDTLTVRSGKAEDAERKLRTTKETKYSFVGFKGLGKSVDKPAVGYAAKAHMTKEDVAQAVLLSPELPALKDIPNRHKQTAEELFKACDQNKDGRVDYLEYAGNIFQSPKHLPDRWQNKAKMDADGDDTLDLKEFTTSLNELAWWRLSRKTPEEWVREADKDKSGELDLEEVKAVIGSAHGKLDQQFKKLDKDKSGGLSVGELKPHLESEIADRN